MNRHTSVSLLYLRHSMLRCTYFMLVLLATLALLYLLGDLAENLDDWLGSGRIVLLRAATYTLDLIDISGRVAGLLALLALLLAWVRGAALGEMTAVEAAGAPPWHHWAGVLFILLPALFFSLTHYVYLGTKLEQWNEQISTYRSTGKIDLSDESSPLEVLTQKIIVRDKNGIMLYEVRRNGITVESILDAQTGVVLRYEPVQNQFTNADTEGTRVSVPFIAPAVHREASTMIWMVLYPLLLAGVGFYLIVRHGRNRGLARQGGRAVLVVVLLWGVDQGSAALFVSGFTRFAAHAVLFAVALTFFLPWRTMINSLSRLPKEKFG